MKKALALLIFFLQLKPVVLEEGSFWQVTDFHYDKTYQFPTDPDKICNSQTPDTQKPNRTGKWGNYLCDSPWRLINSSVFAMKDIEPNPDFIIWTGDDMPHVPNSELSTEEVIETVKNMTALLSTVFTNTTVYPALGNHDYHPKHLMPPKPNDIYTAVGDLWSRWLPQEAVDTFKKGGFYTVLIKPGLRLVSLNTVYYYTNDRLTGNITDPAGQFAWLDHILTNASSINEKVFIIGHVPPGAFERAPRKKWFYPQFNKRYIAVVLKHADVITGHFLAHQHCDSFKIFYDNRGVPRSSIFLCPAVTPWKTVLPTVGYNNPGVRLYKYDRNTTHVKDVWQYYLNLTQANLMGEPDWLLEYKATEDFNIPDVSPQSLHDLVQTFKPQGSSNFLKYYLFNSVSAGGEQCDEECKIGQLCGVTEIDFDQYDACLRGSSRSTVSSTSSVTPSYSISVPSGSSSVEFCFSVTFWLVFIGILLC
ncbi:acid sphingomyelinase-like phosphodiesterase 3b [Orbicella faveolata]|uniref:acid sphingomyelinase-like phosphodiesterase 3b n=1 Tax=Orbicella faveolata TaxID=48498 RepID=UPI0009E5D152|nr:acid sphingomyelinase-like phosphodiesterase 3b [Orbicella faveolata]